MTIEDAMDRIEARGYFVQNVYQASPVHWEVTLRSPSDFYYRQAQGSTLAEAMDKAARAVIKPRRVKLPTKVKQSRVRLDTPTTRLKKRVRLD